MDSRHGIYTHSGVNTQSASRVYINPNFQKHNRALPPNVSVALKSQLHKQTNIQPNINKPKIYVNPNFVRTSTPIPSESEHYVTSRVGQEHVTINAAVNSYTGMPNVSVSKARINTAMLDNCYVNSGRNSTMTAVPSTINLSNITLNKYLQSIKPHLTGVTKSRYSLVRKNNDPVKKTATDNSTVKIRISKYKTVSVDHTKNLHTESDKLRRVSVPDKNSQVVAEKPKKIESRPQFIQSRFKLVKKTQIKRKCPLNSSKVLLRSNQKLRTAIEMAKFKKNNIPCPLYRKYGTCLRNSRWKCEFLHDRKHVSICRKFLKGICHDKTCLLSHEVTAEKMPTCYFYLKGMCTKGYCPYLHIKLNEKANICLDFLKGYCEKGGKCLNRHVNICPDQAIKGVCSKRSCPYPHRTTKKHIIGNKVKARVFNQSLKSKSNSRTDKNTEVKEKYLNQNLNVEEKAQDCRYYKEVVEEVSAIEMIKPTRCKLGALPSFIQL